MSEMLTAKDVGNAWGKAMNSHPDARPKMSWEFEQLREAIDALRSATVARDASIKALSEQVRLGFEKLNDICQQTQDEQVGFAGRLSALEKRMVDDRDTLGRLENRGKGMHEFLAAMDYYEKKWRVEIIDKLESADRLIKQLALNAAQLQQDKALKAAGRRRKSKRTKTS